MKIIATIEARMTSTRLPGKVLAEAEGEPMLALMIERLRYIRGIDQIVIATTVNTTDDAVAALAGRLGVGLWRGSEEDVQSRVLEAARAHKADVIVELTGDCPLIDPRVVQRVLDDYGTGGADYVANVLERTYPIGMDTQVFATDILADAASRSTTQAEREHVSLHIYRNPERYRLRNIAAPKEQMRPKLRLTLDTPQDLTVIRAVFAALRPKARDFSLDDILAYLNAHPEIEAINSGVQHRYV